MASTSRALCLVLLTLAVCQAVTARPFAADPTPRERVQEAFEKVTILSDNLRQVTESISILNAPFKAPLVAQGFTGIVVQIAEINARFAILASDGKLTPFEDADAKLVVESLTTFVQVHQALLNVVIGKYGLLAQFGPFTEPIRVALVSLEAVVDTFAFNIIGIIPTQKSAAEAQFAALSVTLQQALSTYYGLNSRLAADPTPRERLQKAFEEVTTLSAELRQVVVQINFLNVPFKAPLVAQGFAGIVAKIGDINARFAILAAEDKLSPFEDADAKLVVESLTTFVQVHQALLNEVIGKSGIIAQFPGPFLEPIRVALVSLEAVVDTFAFNLIGVIPTQKPAAEGQFGALSVTLQQTISSYDTVLALS